MEDAESVRRDFAAGWAKIGAAWGISPSSAAVQGYLLLHGGPLTETELREALGLSHRAVFGALAECERWGLIEAVAPRRTGARGPAGRAWVAVGDHWAWFRRVAAARKARETDPVLPLLEDCGRRAATTGDPVLSARVASLVAFAGQVDRGIGAVVRSDADVIARLFDVLGRLDDRTLDRFLATLGSVPAAELATAAGRMATMRPSILRRLLGLAARPGIAGLLDRLG
jgi:DNA-binding transcriptional regulator GbsR (MarR family)